VNRSVILACICLGASATGALAADFSAKGSLSETTEGSDNYFLVPTPSGTTLKSLSDLKLDFLARTPTTRYLLDADYSYYRYFGRGDEDTTLTHGAPASASFRIDHTTELAKYNLSASWSRQDLASTLLTQTGAASANGTIDTYTVNGGVTRDIGRADSITLSTQASKAEYTDSTQTPYSDVTTTGTWNHLLSPTTTWITTATSDWFMGEDPQSTQRLFWQIMTGFKSQLTHRLTLTANAGEAFSNAYERNPMAPSVITSFQIQPGAAKSWVANAALNYQVLPKTTVSWTVAQAITPTILGDLQKTDSIGLTLNHAINDWSDLSFSTSRSHTLSLGTEADFFTAQVGYGYKWTREWRTRVSYTYRQSFSTTGLARSNTVLLSLTYDFTLLGNPTAIDQAEKERTRERDQKSLGEVFPAALDPYVNPAAGHAAAVPASGYGN